MSRMPGRYQSHRLRGKQRKTKRSTTLVQGFFIIALAFVITFFVSLGLAIAGYTYIASSLPSPEELRTRSATFASTKIYDRNGGLLYEVFDPQGGRRTLVRLEDISRHLREAIIATEDKYFYQHPGVDPIGIARAVWQNVTEKGIVSGASTITQQLARTVFLSPEERAQRTLSRKIKEAVLATEINRRYSKDTILETYLNTIYYGNLAYGIEAAAETYFGKTAAELSLAEAALLAGLPQSPAIYDPFTNPDAAKARQAIVLGLMVEEGYITPAEAEAARSEELQFIAQRTDIQAPHFVTYVRQLLSKSTAVLSSIREACRSTRPWIPVCKGSLSGRLGSRSPLWPTSTLPTRPWWPYGPAPVRFWPCWAALIFLTPRLTARST